MRLAVALPLALAAASLLSLELAPGALFGPGAGSRLVAFAAGFLPPTHDAAFLSRLGDAALETFAMSLVGTLLAALVALPLAAFAARSHSDTNLDPGPGPGPGPGPDSDSDSDSGHRRLDRRAVALPALLPLARATTRAAFVALRAVPDLVWAALLLVLVGIGPASGTLALALYTSGVLGRLYVDAIEASSDEAARALQANGAAGWRAFVHGRLPLALPALLAWTL